MSRNWGNEAALWWHGLQPDPERGRPGDRGALARLRRAPDLLALLLLPETMALHRRLDGAGERDLPRTALAAGVLARVRTDTGPGCVARALGPADPRDTAQAAMSPLRFRRLIAAEGEAEQLVAFRRMAALAGGALPLRDLADSLLHWDEARRIRWTYEYWNAGAPTRGAEPRTTQNETEDAEA
jgi:CRISPR system Cascade subunit CasB